MKRRTDLGGRWMGVTFLVVVVVATGLLIAGYGFAVGIGALAGLLLAFAAGLFIFLSLWRGDGQVSFGAGPRSHMFDAVVGPWVFDVALIQPQGAATEPSR